MENIGLTSWGMQSASRTGSVLGASIGTGPMSPSLEEPMGARRSSQDEARRSSQDGARRSSQGGTGCHDLESQSDPSIVLSSKEVVGGQAKARSRHRRLSSLAAKSAGVQGASEVRDDELENTLLKRYKMSREELQLMCDRVGLTLSSLCFLKQEFDLYDSDRSGFVDRHELKDLLLRLGETLGDGQLDVAFGSPDQQEGSDDIEFFEFVEWFARAD